MKKNNLILITLSFINFVLVFLLTFFLVPAQIPYFVDFNEKIILIGTKWILFASAIVPLVLAFISLMFAGNKKAIFAINIIFTLFLYENMLKMSYFCTEKSFTIGALSLIPLAVSIFMPLATVILVVAQKIKFVPYKSPFGFCSKYSCKTEFLWKQTHIFATKAVSVFSIFMFLISIIFSFVRLAYIELIIFVLGAIACYVSIILFSKSVYNKFMEMENRKLKMQKPTEKAENIKQNQKNEPADSNLDTGSSNEANKDEKKNQNKSNKNKKQ